MTEATPQNPTAAHIVLDLETLSTKPNAAVIAIGAVAVSATGAIVGEFHIAVDGYSQPGRDIDAATLAWWEEQTPEAKAASLQATDHVSATVAMCKFSAWVLEMADSTTVKMWGNGSSFDCTILSSLYAQCHELGYPQPWAWWNDRDMRTLVDAFPTAKQVGDFEGIKHHALHDARHEAKQLAKAIPLFSADIEAQLQALRKKVATYEARDALGWIPAPAHPDDAAVDRFAAAMKAKLASARAKGRGGWEDKDLCHQDSLALDLRRHVNKGDPVDVGNFAMMLHQRGESTKLRPLSQDLVDAIKNAPVGASVIEHNGHPVFITRATEEGAPLLGLLESNHRELQAQVVRTANLAGEIELRMCNGSEVPQDLESGMVVDILYTPASREGSTT
jgi:hypothetical protein